VSKRARRNKKHGPAKRRRPQPSGPRNRPEDEPSLVRDVADALDEGDPLALLAVVSSVLAALEPPRRGPFDRTPEPELPSRDELVQTFLEVDLVETSALLAAIAALSDDDVLRRRVHREIAARGHALPRWLLDLHDSCVTGVVGMGDVLGDGDNVMIEVGLPGGGALSVVVYIDHNLGTLVKDAFVVSEPLGTPIEQMQSVAGPDPDTTIADLDPAQARARITEAAELAAITFPPLESDTWPACRPLVEWALRLLPEGGTGYQRPVWDDEALDELSERFFGSRFGAGLDDADHRGLLGSLLWFGTDYGPGDPLRWSPVAVEILLADWIPRKIVADAAYLAKAPELLRAFIGFCHHERGIRAELTDQTLAAVDEYEPDYQRTIRSPRPQGPAALLAAMGALDSEGSWPLPEVEPESFPEIMLDSLRRAVGGDDALDRLDAAPLPDEAFGWEDIPPDVHDRVAEVLTLVDRCCDELLDVEYRTACRRLLARAAAGDADIFRRRGRAETAAAAVCWIIGKANDLFSSGAILVKDLTSHFGIQQGSVSQRSEPLLRAVGVDPRQYGAMDLGSPDYLTSSCRERILARREHYRAMETTP
jgi:hypothetical protein